MEWNKLITPIVGITVSIICLATILMPVIDDTATISHKYVNNTDESIALFNKVKPADSIIFEWDYTKPTEAVINGTTVNLPDPTDYLYGLSLITTQGLALRYYKSGIDYVVQSIGGGQPAGYYALASVASSSNLRISIEDGTFTNLTDNRMYGLTGNTYYVYNTGDYVLKSSDQTVYLLGDSNTIATGLSVISGDWVIMGWDSNRGIDIDPVVYYPTDGYTISDVNIVASNVDGYVNLSSITSLSYIVTDSENNQTTVTYSYFIVPASVDAELSEHLPTGAANVLHAIPVMVVLVILMAAASMIMRNRE